MIPHPTVLALVLAGCGVRAAEPPPTAPTEAPKMELHLEETAVATVGDWRVALAKTWEEKRDGRKQAVAWLSVVQKGSTAGQRDEELSVGQKLVLGDRTLTVVEVKLAGKEAGSVTLRED